MTGSQVQETVLPFEFDPEANRWLWSEGMRDLFGLRPDQAPSTKALLGQIAGPDGALLAEQLEAHLSTPGPFTCTFEVCDGRGRARKVRYVADGEAVSGEVKRVHGFVIDVTDVWGDYAAKAVAGAVEHRAVIEQAKGALMLTFGVDDAAAFDLLRGYSSHSNLKLHVVAERISTGLATARLSRDDPVGAVADIVATLT
jgi:hypothetical protein